VRHFDVDGRSGEGSFWIRKLHEILIEPFGVFRKDSEATMAGAISRNFIGAMERVETPEEHAVGHGRAALAEGKFSRFALRPLLPENRKIPRRRLTTMLGVGAIIPSSGTRSPVHQIPLRIIGTPGQFSEIDPNFFAAGGVDLFREGGEVKFVGAAGIVGHRDLHSRPESYVHAIDLLHELSLGGIGPEGVPAFAFLNFSTGETRIRAEGLPKSRDSGKDRSSPRKK